MQVVFQSTYFASTDSRQMDKMRVASGRRYRKGEKYHLSDAEYEQAVRDGASFKVVDGTVPEVDRTVHSGTLRDYDADRAASDAYVAVLERAAENEPVKKRGPGRPRKNP